MFESKMKIDLNRIQDLWNCGHTDKEILEALNGNFTLKQIKQAREKLGLYENE